MVYVFFADGFEEIEAVTIVDVLRRGGVDVATVGIGSRSITGTHGLRIETDIADTEAADEGIEMIVLPGGQPGTDNLGRSATVARLIGECLAAEKWVAAIFAAPMVLGQAGVLQGRRAVCYPGCEGALTGAQLSGDNVVRDGNIITSKGPGTAMEFALALLMALKGEAAAAEVAAGMLLA